MNRLVLSAISVAFLMLVAACDGGPAGPKDPTELDFDPALGVDLSQMTRTPSGLYYQDLELGTGEEAQAGAFVTVHYTGWLHDGTMIDTSLGGDPIRFSLNSVIQGWSEGVPGMRVGGKRKLVIPPALGYGKERYLDIPGNSTLVFDIELVGVG